MVSSLNSRVGFMTIGGPFRATFFRQHGLVSLPLSERLDFWRSASIAENPYKVRVPSLVQVSDDELLGSVDGFETLRELKRPVELYVFPNEHHVKWQPAHRLALYRRNLQWFDFWLMDRRHDDPVDPDQYGRWETLRERAAASPQ